MILYLLLSVILKQEPWEEHRPTALVNDIRIDDFIDYNLGWLLLNAGDTYRRQVIFCRFPDQTTESQEASKFSVRDLLIFLLKISHQSADCRMKTEVKFTSSQVMVSSLRSALGLK